MIDRIDIADQACALVNAARTDDEKAVRACAAAHRLVTDAGLEAWQRTQLVQMFRTDRMLPVTEEMQCR